MKGKKRNREKPKQLSNEESQIRQEIMRENSNKLEVDRK